MKDLIYITETDKEVLDKVIDIAEAEGFSVDITNNRDNKSYNLFFSKISSAGRDFGFDINFYAGDYIDKIQNAVEEYYENFDVSYETYLWLDNFGHGINGAPYELIDVYNDTKECESMINDLAYALNVD